MGIVVVAAGGFGREILDVLDARVDALAPASSDFLGFLDDDPSADIRVADLGERVLGPVNAISSLDASYLIGIGSPSTRRRVDQTLVHLGGTAHSGVQHRMAARGRRVRLGPGHVICAGAILTTNIVAGRHLHVNLNATIGHDCVIGDYVTIAPGVSISGNVTIGDDVEFGTGAVVLPGLTIGAGAMVGAGAVVTKDVAPGTTVVGMPARPR